MATQINLYAGQPADTDTILFTGPALTITTITYAEAYNTSADILTLDLFFGTEQIAKGIVLGPHETVTLFPILGAVLVEAATLNAIASVTEAINVRIDGHQTTLEAAP